MTVLRRFLGQHAYQALLVLLFLATLLYQKEVDGHTPFLQLIPFQKPGPAISETTLDTVRVKRVIDGDTIEIDGGEHVRLIGIDAPESVKPNSPVECFGRESSAHLKQLIEGKVVRLERDQTEHDRYARLLRYVYLDNDFINERLVREGYAASVRYRPDTKWQDKLDEAERLAKTEYLGLWGKGVCP